MEKEQMRLEDPELRFKVSQRIGKIVKKYRLMQGLELDQVAKKIQVTTNTLRNFERGSLELSVGKIVYLFRALNIPYDLLFESETDDGDAFDPGEFIKNYRLLNSTSIKAVHEFVRTLATFQNFRNNEASLQFISYVIHHEYKMLSDLAGLANRLFGNDGNDYEQAGSQANAESKVSMDVKETLLATYIEDINISYRARKSLMAAGYKAIHDLVNASIYDLMKIRGFGDVSLQELRDYLKLHNLSLQEDGKIKLADGKWLAVMMMNRIRGGTF